VHTAATRLNAHEGAGNKLTTTIDNHVLLTRDNEVATVTLNCPERKNAMSWPMWQRLLAVLRELSEDTSARVVVITGAGGAFCSGNDLSTPRPRMHPLLQMNEINNAVLALHRLPKITVARVDGDAIGAGLNLALACDIVVASDRSRFSEIFVRRGLSVDFGGSWILPRLIGLHRAKELCLTGEIIGAEEALRIGLVSRFAVADELDDVLDSLIERLLLGAPVAQLLTKRLLNDGALSTLEQAVESEAAAQIVNLGSSDAAEAHGAFLERRTPRFTGSWPSR
jgi:enoyl-CoA hydratase/carnithine racemase